MSNSINYTLTRSKRKTLTLCVHDDGRVEARAPLRMPEGEIDRFVESKRKWIERQLAKSAAQNEKKAAFKVDYGSRLPLGGKEYLVTGWELQRVMFVNGFCMPYGLSPEQVKRCCVQMYRSMAEQELTEKAEGYAGIMHVEPTAIKINGAKRRWGSCSAKKSINFSWRIMMADDDVIDYLVVHELAHIKEMNHSPRFWAVVESVLPDYKARRTRLRQFQKKLAEQDWE